MGDKGRQDPRGGGHTIQQRETRRETMETGGEDLGKADTPSKEGKREGREAGDKEGQSLGKEGLGRIRKDWEGLAKKMGKTRKDWERVGRTVKDQEGLRKDWDRSWKGRTGKE